jgi:hypothetical protein
MGTDRRVEPLSSNPLACPFCGEPPEESGHWRDHWGCSDQDCGAYQANLSRAQWNKRTGHCKDCCCARSWQALGVTDYTGMSIPEHIERLRALLTRVYEWTPAFPVEAGLLDEIGEALETPDA